MNMDIDDSPIIDLIATPAKFVSKDISKRKYQDDSGYATPCSSQLLISPILSTKKHTSTHNVTLNRENILCNNHVLLHENQTELSDHIHSANDDSCFEIVSLYHGTPEINSQLNIDLDENKGFSTPILNDFEEVRKMNTYEEFCSDGKKLKYNLKNERRYLSRDIFTHKKKFPVIQEFQTISKSLQGCKEIDFLHYLDRYNASHIISMILSQISDSDLINARMVSKTWRRLCNEDLKVKRRCLTYILTKKLNLENFGISANGEKRKNSGNPLSTNSNHSTPLKIRQPSSPPISPDKARFHLFQKEAKKLRKDEHLMKCPRCTFPSRCTPSKGLGECSADFCQMRFCIKCRSPYHDPSPCVQITSSPKKIVHRFRDSRRYLRRLL